MYSQRCSRIGFMRRVPLYTHSCRFVNGRWPIFAALTWNSTSAGMRTLIAYGTGCRCNVLLSLQRKQLLPYRGPRQLLNGWPDKSTRTALRKSGGFKKRLVVTTEPRYWSAETCCRSKDTGTAWQKPPTCAHSSAGSKSHGHS